jgi:uncharacterized protein YbjQ (UPF0145 family)
MPIQSKTAAKSRKRAAKKVAVHDLVPKAKVKGGDAAIALNFSKIELTNKPKS